jgi:3-methyl-2-oxobutanoate hydroxymethyltransferase
MGKASCGEQLLGLCRIVNRGRRLPVIFEAFPRKRAELRNYASREIMSIQARPKRLSVTQIRGRKGGAPKFVKRYRRLGEEIRAAAREYAEEVRQGRFPAAEHTYSR